MISIHVNCRCFVIHTWYDYKVHSGSPSSTANAFSNSFTGNNNIIFIYILVRDCYIHHVGTFLGTFAWLGVINNNKGTYTVLNVWQLVCRYSYIFKVNIEYYCYFLDNKNHKCNDKLVTIDKNDHYILNLYIVE